MTPYRRLQQELRAEPRTWLVTGAAGFIGSHLVEALLGLGQTVVGLDNFSTGSPWKLDDVRRRVSEEAWTRFTFHEGTVMDMSACRAASNHIDYVLHQAGFVSVPLSIEDPIGCHGTNVTGTLNLLVAARDNRVRRVVYASSSAVYGDDARMPKIEEHIGHPLSPYAASKAINETQARLFHDLYGLEAVGLRYFNVFGPRQNPSGGYAAVIPHWIVAILAGQECVIHGDGGITRDFCHVADIVQANLLAATTRERRAIGQVFNVGLGTQTTLDELHATLTGLVAELTGASAQPVVYGLARPGDIRHSGADIGKITRVLGFAPELSLSVALADTVRAFSERL